MCLNPTGPTSSHALSGACSSQFYLHQCQTHSHPRRFYHTSSPAAWGSRGSIPLESPPLPTPGRGGGVQTESEAQDLAASSLPSPETHLTPICEPSGQCQPTPHDLGPYPLLRGLQVCSEDVVVDTFVAKPQGEGALNEDRPGWVVAGQSGLLIGTLDTWCGSMHTQGALAESKEPGRPPSRPSENPAALYAGPYLQYAAQWDLLYLWSLWMKPSAKKNRGGSFWPPTEELGRNGEGGSPANSGLVYWAAYMSLKPNPSSLLSSSA